MYTAVTQNEEFDSFFQVRYDESEDEIHIHATSNVYLNMSVNEAKQLVKAIIEVVPDKEWV